ncbi:peptidoglycan editing factor PgeF [Paraburkholderia phosphatilytica]|uniref:peptidoglycan editing factor PgeF n=1 Tax=Paraburkholderia phosphatilytica TaxID=2282883 RepID=UPI001F0BCE36|nr:peptidoglycan editing factor PgeF [Paraburkholderia phosphatilytica]
MSEHRKLPEDMAADPANLPELTEADVLRPAWRVSPRVKALVTTRNGGVSLPPYGRYADGVDGPGGLNLGVSTDDDRDRVLINRRRLAAMTGAPVAWLQQIHGADVVDACDALAATREGVGTLRADASVTDRSDTVCIVMIADCMPVLICDSEGRAVGAAHAGWRGLAAGVIENAARRVASLAGGSTATLHAYLGPCIGPTAFEVGADVRDAFMTGVDGEQRDATSAAFIAHPQTPGKFLANLPALARVRLQAIGVTNITGGDACTVTERDRFYSYRRDRVTGRMAALIWLSD